MDSKQEIELIKFIQKAAEDTGYCNINEASKQILFYTISEKAQQEIADKIIRSKNFTKEKVDRDWIVYKNNFKKGSVIEVENVKQFNLILHVIIVLGTFIFGYVIDQFISKEARPPLPSIKNILEDTSFHWQKNTDTIKTKHN